MIMGLILDEKPSLNLIISKMILVLEVLKVVFFI